jgi:hypothetical protein
MADIAFCKIFPSIGIARLGNSPEPDGFFVGHELPGRPPLPEGGFKDDLGRVKRQAARFRVYAFDNDGKARGELKGQGVQVTWTVQLANKKAAWYQFSGASDVAAVLEEGKVLPLRNWEIQGEHTQDPDRRDRLINAPQPGSVAGPNQRGVPFVGTVFDPPVKVYLGELRTDAEGRLLVLGGRGHSDSVLDKNPLKHYANNNFWYDDTSDGPVTARVTVDGREVEVRGRAWVIVTPPSFSPHTGNIVTAYDVMVEAALNHGLVWPEAELGPRPDPDAVSFTADIYPLLRRLVNYRWVSRRALRGHGPGRPGDFLQKDVLEQLARKDDAGAALRQAIFRKVRNPFFAPDSEDARAQANLFHMPPLSGDEGDATHADPSTWLTVTRLQYHKLEKWASGDFASDWQGEPLAPAGPADADGAPPGELTRAVLLACVGGAFFPGIEMTSIIRHKGFYAEAFRVADGLKAGDVTKWMALPWQADFYECQTHWWPAQRPDDVVNEEEFDHVIVDFPKEAAAGNLTTLLEERQPWDRGIGQQGIPEPPAPDLPQRNPGETAVAYYQRVRSAVERYVGGVFRLPGPEGGESDEAYDRRIRGILANEWTRRRRHAGKNDMVQKWSTLGFVVPRQAPDKEVILVEGDRGRYEGLKDREYFFYMMNVEAYPDFLPQAKRLAEAFLKEARRKQHTPDELEPYYYPIEYSPAAFDARLEQIYEILREQNETYDPADPDQETTFRTREQVIERIRQLAPFNQTDGAWLRNAARAGPTEEIRALLFSIWMDEAGNGDPSLNHPNVYVELLHSVGIYLPPINSHAYANHPDFLDSAFTVPLLQLVMSQFTEEFFPEILGMTLWLEWEVLGLKPIIKLFNYHGLNPHFYTMHVGIDNAVDGHGARARRAVELYLDLVEQESGAEEMQRQWRRVWDGYIVFSHTGSISEDLRYLLAHPPTLNARMEQLIESRRAYGQRNHGQKKLGDNYINDWFEDPSGFLDALARSRFVVPGRPDESDFFRLTSFTGPMYKVFGERELKLWSDWVRSLGQPDQPLPPPADEGEAMLRLVKKLRTAGLGAPGHQQIGLTGPDPERPGQRTTRPVAWWFRQVDDQGDPAEQDRRAASFLAALSDGANGWVVKGQPALSRLVISFFDYNHPMGRALSGPFPEAGGKTGRDLIWNWIKAGCPIPGARPQAAAVAPAPPAAGVEARAVAAAAASATPARPPTRPLAVRRPARVPRFKDGMGGYVH